MSRRKKPLEVRVADVDDAEVRAGEQRRERRLEVDRDRVREDAAAVELDAGQLAHPAVRAVGADEILRADRLLSAGVDIPHGRRHARRVLRERRSLHGRRARARRRASARRRRIGSSPGCVTNRRRQGLNASTPALRLGTNSASTLPGERVHQDDRAFGLELLERLRADVVFDARRAEQLQRAHVEERRARQLRALLQTLDGERGDAVLGEEHGGRQSDQTAAGNRPELPRRRTMSSAYDTRLGPRWIEARHALLPRRTVTAGMSRKGPWTVTTTPAPGKSSDGTSRTRMQDVPTFAPVSRVDYRSWNRSDHLEKPTSHSRVLANARDARDPLRTPAVLRTGPDVASEIMDSAEHHARHSLRFLLPFFARNLLDVE